MPEVVALYKYSYLYEGKTITFKKGERFQLLDKPNGDWWHVRRWQEVGQAEDIYVPANYVKEEEVKEEEKANPLYENMSDLATSYKKTKENLASGDGKKEKTLPPPIRQKPTRGSVDRPGEKAQNGHIPQQGHQPATAPGTKKDTNSPEHVRKNSTEETSSPQRTRKLLEMATNKPRSKTFASDEGTSNLDRNPNESSLDRLPQSTVSRPMITSVSGSGVAGGSAGPPPSVKPKPGRHAALTRSVSDAERSTVLKPLPSSSAPEVSTFVPPAPADLRRPARTHSYEPVLPLTKTPSPDQNGENTHPIPKVNSDRQMGSYMCNISDICQV